STGDCPLGCCSDSYQCDQRHAAWTAAHGKRARRFGAQRGNQHACTLSTYCDGQRSTSHRVSAAAVQIDQFDRLRRCHAQRTSRLDIPALFASHTDPAALLPYSAPVDTHVHQWPTHLAYSSGDLGSARSVAERISDNVI